MKFKIVEEVKKSPEDFDITKYKFRPDGTLDVFGDVYLRGEGLEELPFKFGEIDGDFNCSGNYLKSLKGAPKIVNGTFRCNYNFDNLTNLKYAPEIVKGDFRVMHNNLKTLSNLNLDGISGDIYLWDNPKLKFTEKEQLWMTLNPGRIIL